MDFGLVRDYKILNDEAQLTATFGRFKYPPWGGGGGGDGSPNAVEIIPSGMDKALIRRGKLARYVLRKGDTARLITGVGGGYGDPLTRNPKLVQEDVRDEYFSNEKASGIYGVVIDPSTGDVDQAATQILRHSLSKRTNNEDV